MTRGCRSRPPDVLRVKPGDGTHVRENIVEDLGRSTIRRRVLIADDHCIVAEGIRSVLEKRYDVVGIVGDGRELLIEAPMLNPDVIVVDIGMLFFERSRRCGEVEAPAAQCVVRFA